MKCLSIRSLVTAFLCVNAAIVYGDNTPFPNVIPMQAGDTSPFAAAVNDYPDEAYLYRIHNDAYYHAVSVSGNGEFVQLHDGSMWSIKPSQRNLVLYWVQNDDIFIKPCISCFSSYSYVLYNRTTRKAIEANYIKDPNTPMNTGVLYILNIHPYARLVELTDHTVWQIDPKDATFPYWQRGQRMLVGVNNYWRTAPYPNILINADLYKEPYTQADFYGYSEGH